MSTFKVFLKSQFPLFLEALKTQGTVYAPVKVSKESYSFKAVQNADEIAFEALRTILPPKKFFYPQEEKVFSYSGDKIIEPVEKTEYKVIFGIHPCDLAGLDVLDSILTHEPADPKYIAKRQQSLIVGFSCLPDKHCFCKSMGNGCPDKGYDMFLTELSEHYYLEIKTSKGLIFAEKVSDILQPVSDQDKDDYKRFWQERDGMFTNGFVPDNLTSTFEMEWDNPIWDELGQRCLSCGNCTPVCPTCYCFDLVDIANLNGTDGDRVRQWDSCQFVGFAKVAGDYNFRPTPVDRLKFWYRHKLHGFEDAYAFRTCVGCGRCTVSCPSGIDDIVGVVKALQESKEKKGVKHHE